MIANDKPAEAPSVHWPACDVCGKPTDRSDGYLRITWTRIQEIQREQRAERTTEPELINLAGVLPIPRDWQWGHSECLPESDYWIEASRIDTLRKAMAWTLHLMEKNWFAGTDWERAIRRLYDVGSC